MHLLDALGDVRQAEPSLSDVESGVGEHVPRRLRGLAKLGDEQLRIEDERDGLILRGLSRARLACACARRRQRGLQSLLLRAVLGRELPEPLIGRLERGAHPLDTIRGLGGLCGESPGPVFGGHNPLASGGEVRAGLMHGDARGIPGGLSRAQLVVGGEHRFLRRARGGIKRMEPFVRRRDQVFGLAGVVPKCFEVIGELRGPAPNALGISGQTAVVFARLRASDLRRLELPRLRFDPLAGGVDHRTGFGPGERGSLGRRLELDDLEAELPDLPTAAQRRRVRAPLPA